jgi:hypothetical protein
VQRQVTLYFGPFNAEAAWRDPAAASLPEVKDGQAQRVVEALDEVQFAFCQEGDVLLTAREMIGSHRAYLESLGFHFEHARAADPLPPRARASPYAVVPQVEEFCARHGIGGDLPSVKVVRQVNSKAYSHRLATKLSLFGAGRVVGSLDELSAEANALLPRGRLIVKDPFGVSGKGAVVVREQSDLARLLEHLRKQRDAGRFIQLLVQPLYDRVTDFSCHFEVSSAGWHPLGVQVMDNDGLAFSSVRPAPLELLDTLDARGQWGTMEQVARALAADGYRGPVCVDAMLLRDGTLVPLLEINARKSMGLINLRLQQRAPNGLLSHLSVLNLSFRRVVAFDDLLGALRQRQLLYDGERPGVLPLSGNAVVVNLLDGPGLRARGRLYASVMAPNRIEASKLLSAVEECLVSLGIDVPRRPA